MYPGMHSASARQQSAWYRIEGIPSHLMGQEQDRAANSITRWMRPIPEQGSSCSPKHTHGEGLAATNPMTMCAWEGGTTRREGPTSASATGRTPSVGVAERAVSSEPTVSQTCAGHCLPLEQLTDASLSEYQLRSSSRAWSSAVGSRLAGKTSLQGSTLVGTPLAAKRATRVPKSSQCFLIRRLILPETPWKKSWNLSNLSGRWRVYRAGK
ncbi:hypothetical protein LXA43DRAFT_454899 [Ganoderma leucocontextum]|nr:hypothetical protein LXA43DRAFT_454899 [Ganoderma leucocontextum]